VHEQSSTEQLQRQNKISLESYRRITILGIALSRAEKPATRYVKRTTSRRRHVED